jgi:beta-xylosidase
MACQLINRSTPGAEDVDWVFDPRCFVDDDGQAYLYFGGGMPDTGDNARVIRLGEDMVSLADESATTSNATSSRRRACTTSTCALPGPGPTRSST